MKTLVLSSDEIETFQKATQLSNESGNCNLMALQYYLKHTNSGSTVTQSQLRLQKQQQQACGGPGIAKMQPHHAINQPQIHYKQMQLKQPTVHQQHVSYHHHPYYQQHSQQSNIPQTSTNGLSFKNSVPVHTLNQNSNFSAASSSTGGGTASSHAPTTQSNTTGSSFSPPVAGVNIKTIPAKGGSNSSTATSTTRSINSTKKLKTEPVLSQIHQSERLSFANTHIIWGEEQWKRVVFQDERKFNLDGPDGFAYYYHDLRNYERSLSQRPRGYSVYLYAIITAGGSIHMEVSPGKLSADACMDIILRERANIVTKLGGNIDFILQDHNWGANGLPNAQGWLDTEGIKTQKWPSIAHDLNIMENVWGWLIREVYDGGRKFSRKDDLIFRIKEAWSRLPIDLLSNLYSTLPERITELYYTRGVYTNC